MLAMFLILLMALGNFALGFFLAVYLGQGPAGWKTPSVEAVRLRLRSLLRLDRNAATH